MKKTNDRCQENTRSVTGEGTPDTRPGVPLSPSTHPKYPTIDTAGRITTASKVLAFVFVILLPAVAAGVAVGLAVQGLVTWADIGILAGMYVVTATGTTVGYHRLFTHRSFQAPGWVRYTLAVLGCMNAQGAPIIWAAQHRKHHAFSEEDGDPHSPHLGRPPGLRGALRGLWHSHFGHVFNQVSTIEPERYVPDLEREGVLRWMEKWSALIVVAGMLIPGAAGWYIAGSWEGGLTGVLWGGFVRLFLVTHATGAVNSLCHYFGSRRFDIKDRSGNVWWLVLPTMGESWHHNHHAFPTSARHGLLWWELDPSWAVIWAMEKLGLAWTVVRVPKSRQTERLATRRDAA